MAPTEVLAEQHFTNFRRWFGPLGVSVRLLTGSRKADSEEPQELFAKKTARSSRGNEAQTSSKVGRLGTEQSLVTSASTTFRAKLFIGTHALIAERFEVADLGLVIIDEQHKFGVSQREQLVRKGNFPHLLVMTATPIPRTLGLTLYGDLDVSTIDQAPEGRGAIQTFIRSSEALPKVWNFVRSKLDEGRQAYVVYPRVEETGENGIKSVTKEFDSLKQALAPYRVGLVHGRLAAREKERVMTEFRANTVQVLLATSLIEVGVDVPNATVMLVENAEQFGLAQLHQLRGRIGRGSHRSYCILVASVKTTQARQRLRVLEQTGDGFEIAEADLKLRGPGELLGQDQAGMPRFRFGDLLHDMELIQQAREIAAQQPTSAPMHDAQRHR
jgi:ATP-dependent DNA helicase RecG